MRGASPTLPSATGSAAAPAAAAAFIVLFAVPLVPGVVSSSGAGLLCLSGEALAVLLVLTIVPWTSARRVIAVLFAVFTVASIALAALDAAYRETLARPFVPVSDGAQVVAAYGVVRDAVGQVAAVLILVGVIVVAAGAVCGIAWAALRASRSVVLGGRRALAALSAAAAVWILCAAAGADLVPGVHFAAADATGTMAGEVTRSIDAVLEQAAFEQAQRADPFRDVAPDDLLTALRGKDVVIAFIESYGRVAVQGAAFSAGVDRVLREGGSQLSRDGYTAQSAFLTSPTFGGVSWLAHSTLQTGLWIDSQLKYDHVTATDRLTLSRAFGDAGWRTVADVPSNEGPWPIGASFYGYDEQLDAFDVGYRGPSFSYARIPDQYTWQHFADVELAGPHAPVMAEIDFVSSHTPWTPLPRLVSWSELGDGSVFDGQPAQGIPPGDAWRDPHEVQRLYGESVKYSLGAMFSFLHTYDQPDLVLIVLGDHQPAPIVSGPDASHDVPVTIIAKDPAVFERIATWDWDDGLLPSPSAPVWRMDAFRDRFLTAFGPE